jgi:hypothetical protein
MKVKLEFQYFEGCPNHKKMSDNLEKAIKGLENKIELGKVLVEDESTALKTGFRGSPTLLINGEDIEGVPAPVEPSLSCRFYVNGIPSSDEIGKIIIQKINME